MAFVVFSMIFSYGSFFARELVASVFLHIFSCRALLWPLACAELFPADCTIVCTTGTCALVRIQTSFCEQTTYYATFYSCTLLHMLVIFLISALNIEQVSISFRSFETLTLSYCTSAIIQFAMSSLKMFIYLTGPYLPSLAFAQPFFARPLSKIGLIFERFFQAPWARL